MQLIQLKYVVIFAMNLQYKIELNCMSTIMSNRYQKSQIYILLKYNVRSLTTKIDAEWPTYIQPMQTSFDLSRWR